MPARSTKARAAPSIKPTSITRNTGVRRASYVALTRHRDKAELFVARNTAKDVNELARQMARTDERRAASMFHHGLEIAPDPPADREGDPRPLRRPGVPAARSGAAGNSSAGGGDAAAGGARGSGRPAAAGTSRPKGAAGAGDTGRPGPVPGGPGETALVALVLAARAGGAAGDTAAASARAGRPAATERAGVPAA